MEKLTVSITFKDQKDFRNRIAKLFQDQKENETYDFTFLDKETEEEFEKLMSAFQ